MKIFSDLKAYRLLVTSVCLASCFLLAVDVQAATPHANDPDISRQLKELKPGESLLLPKVKHMADGKPIDGTGRNGPYSRDYTNKMVYAPERQTALYAGGNHGAGRMNDVWEYHLGSNTWHRLHIADGGDHARFKFALMFYPRMILKNPNPELNDKQQAEIATCQPWWNENVVLRDGNFVMRNTGAPLLVGHTWDTLMYDPINKRLVHGTGAHCANLPWLEHRFRGTPLAEVEAAHGKRADGTPWRRPWTFDPATGKWSPYAHSSPIPELDGMAGSLLYIPDRQQAVWYYAAQNTPGAPHVMALWDLKNDTWTDLKPNDGVSLGKLSTQLKVAPISEQQMVYYPPRQQIIAVLGQSTFGYDFASNAWSKLNDSVPFDAHDAKTVFVYDEQAQVCLLCAPNKNQVAAFDPHKNEWRGIEPDGPGIPKPAYNVGKGYYDPTHRVFVVHAANMDRIWVYRHPRAA
ncbi:hypothetical protein ETAA8_04480 [Anatilimnocola aggregata]|uniref:Uncharacterized protein n=1 Tax=Anatilimnocola aggregata TaxID=2528021 RepID=A0A517Y5A7_9BACT|nr:hypothetical protein [Anatilimnocola aggregata]QDU25380.1 hypothetical protein ETAA8_04480 [Anatilimnocola aggregata]